MKKKHRITMLNNAVIFNSCFTLQKYKFQMIYLPAISQCARSLNNFL